jgi:hypothetical protein
VDLKREGATGIEAGVEDVASSLTSPLSVALAFATFGAGPLLESMGIKVAQLVGPQLLAAAKTAGKLASVGFTGLQLKGISDAEPAFKQAVLNGDTDKALEIGTQMAFGLGAAALGAKHAYDSYFGNPAEIKFTSKDKLIGTYQRMLKEDDVQARTFNTEFKKAVPDVGTREAIQFHAEAGGDATKLADWQQRIEASKDINPALQRQTVAALKKAQQLSPEEIAQAGKLRELYDPDFEEAVDHDVLSTESKKTDYVARARWTDEPVEEENVAKAKVALGESNQPNHTKQRIFSTTVDGLENGYEPVKVGNRFALDSADIAADYHRAIGKEIAKKVFVENARKARAEDLRPFAVQSGGGHTIDPLDDHPNADILKGIRDNSDDISTDPAIAKGPTITNSNSIPDKTLTKAEIGALGQDGLDKLVSDGKVTEDGGKYRWDTSGYDNSIRTPQTNGYAYGGAPNVLVKAPVAFHPDIAEQAKMILAPEASKLRQNPISNALLNVGQFAKHTLLGGSGFHWVQEGLRGIESGTNPFNLEKWDMTNPEHVRLVEAGGIQPGIEQGANAFTEGVKGSGLLAKIPGLSSVIEKSNENLFGPSGFIDRLKLTTALKFAERLKDSNPDLDLMTRYKVAGQMANARFGGLNYLAMGRSKELQDIMRLTLLAPDWIESQVRDTGFALAYPKIGATDLARIATYNFIAARALNYMVSGKPHMEEPFGVVSDDGKKVFSVRTMPSDIYHAVSNPMDFAANRLNPVTVRTAVEAITGKDKMGHTRSMAEQVSDLFQNMTPIPAQGLVDKMRGTERPNASWSDSALSAAGATTRANLSPAEQTAYRLSSQRAGSGPVPSEQLAKHHLVMQLEDRLRSGDTGAMNDVRAASQGGLLAPDDVKKIAKDSKVSRLQSVVKSLPMSNALDVWDKATNAEREQLAPVVLKKMVAFRKTEHAKLTEPEQNRMNIRMAKLVNDIQQRGSEPQQ